LLGHIDVETVIETFHKNVHVYESFVNYANI